MVPNIHHLVNQKILNLDPKAEVILFGSRARGDFREDSDWDFLILLDISLNQHSKDLILETLYDLELNTNSIISPLIHNKTDWNNKFVTPLYSAILKEGKRA
jgi:uncharacterized protein